MNRKVGLLVALLVTVLVGGLLLAADRYRESPEVVEASYSGRDSCVKCHQTEAALFHGSDHDLAMDLATDATVLADFDDQSLEHHGITSRMFRDGKKFMVNTEGPDGVMKDFEVKYVFGVRPLQQYMVELEAPVDGKPNEIGRVQVLRLSWDANRNKWFYLDPPDVSEKLDPDDPLHWTGITQNWNTSCASCHSTNLQKNFDLASNSYHTTFSEIDVSCEACHGPGSYHIELANRASLFWDRNHGYGLAKLKTENNRAQIETCAPCHSRRGEIRTGFQPGCNFDDYFALQLISDPVYHADGQIRDEDYVYGSFIQSKMYHNGIKCSDCHDPHSAKVKFTDNRLCTSCHQHPAGKYDSPSHHHHEPGTPGASCVECHMPATTYMAVDPRRDHSFRVPRPGMSVTLGTPNSCTACHLDASKLVGRESEKPLTQYLDWIIAAEQGDDVVKQELARVDQLMADAAEKWYPAEQSPDKTKYYEQIAQGLVGGPEKIPTLVELAKDITSPAMLRASALSELSADLSEASLEAAMEALEDKDTKVVSAALIRLDNHIGSVMEQYRYSNVQVPISKLRPTINAVMKLFRHPAQRVRTESARVFVSLPPQVKEQFATHSADRVAFEKALAELIKSVSVDNDRAASYLMLGGLYQMQGDSRQAIESYRNAIKVEPNLSGPRGNMAALLEGEASLIRQNVQQQQAGGITVAQMKSMLGQVQELGRRAQELRREEHEMLGKDVRRSEGLASTHGLHYRYGMSCYLQRDLESAEKHLLEAYRQQPEESTYLFGLAAYYLRVEKGDEAMKYIGPLLKQDPRNAGYQSLFEQAKALMEK